MELKAKEDTSIVKEKNKIAKTLIKDFKYKLPFSAIRLATKGELLEIRNRKIFERRMK